MSVSLFLLAVIAITTVAAIPVENQPTPQEKLADALNGFAFDVYKNLHNDPSTTTNVFLSPFSIATAFSMLSLGARSNTQQQLRSALKYDEVGLTEEEVHTAFKNMLTQVLSSTNDEYELDLANKAYIAQDYPVLESYKQDLRNMYHADIEPTDFSQQEAVKQRINEYVSQATRGKIPDLLSEPLREDTALLLLNAIYFKGEWRNQFLHEDTIPKPFYNNGANAKDVPTMIALRDANFTSSRDLDSKVLELPYKGDHVSMIFILPNQRDGLPTLQRIVTKDKILRALQSLRTRESVSIEIPKYKLTEEYDLQTIMERLNVTDAFSRNSDLSGICEAVDLFVSKASHKAVVEVNEEGSSAAAVTTIVGVPMSSEINIEDYLPTFHADHPFIFLIVDKILKTVLFMGAVNEL